MSESKTPRMDALQIDLLIAKESTLEKGMRLIAIGRELETELQAANDEISRLTIGIKEICNTCEMIKGEREISNRKDAEIAKRDRVIEKILDAATWMHSIERARAWVKKELGK